MLERLLGLAALAAAAAGLAGCGGSASATSVDAIGSQLAIYSSLPLQGPTASISQQVVNGEKLALAAVGGRVGRFKIGYVSLDDSSPKSGKWDPGVTSTDAKYAAQDTSTIAYLGDYNSAGTAISLPLINGAGIPQVSPASPYVGLTQSTDAGQDEPERFYPTGQRTFARLQPGDPVQATAQVGLMQSLGVKSLYVLDDEEPFQVPLAELVAGDATAAGITVAGHDSMSVSANAIYKGEVEKILASGAQAVFFSGEGSEGAAALFRQLHSADPSLVLLGPSTLVEEPFASQIGSAAASTYLTTPTLARSMYPRSAQRVLALYGRDFGEEGTPYALYGYEAMSLVLSAIRASGVHGNDRQSVIEHLFATRNRDSVLGRYSIEPDGEPTFARYGVDRVVDGRPVFYKAIPVRP